MGLARVRDGELQELDATYPVCGFESTYGNPAARLRKAVDHPLEHARRTVGGP